jgi:hypothetical protein
MSNDDLRLVERRHQIWSASVGWSSLADRTRPLLAKQNVGDGAMRHRRPMAERHQGEPHVTEEMVRGWSIIEVSLYDSVTTMGFWQRDKVRRSGRSGADTVALQRCVGELGKNLTPSKRQICRIRENICELTSKWKILFRGREKLLKKS